MKITDLAAYISSTIKPIVIPFLRKSTHLRQSQCAVPLPQLPCAEQHGRDPFRSQSALIAAPHFPVPRGGPQRYARHKKTNICSHQIVLGGSQTTCMR